jgi:cytochrome P450
VEGTRFNSTLATGLDSGLPAIQPLRAPSAWQTLRYVHDAERFFAAARRRHGSCFTLTLLGQRWVMLADPHDIARLLALAPDAADGGEASQALRPLIGTSNMLMLGGEQYLHRRRIVLPTFHGERMRSYETTIRRTVRSELASWPTGEVFPALPRVSALAFQIMLQCVFGVDDHERVGPLAGALLRMLHWITDTRQVLTFFLLGPERLMRLPSYRRMITTLDRHTYAEIAGRRRAPDLYERQDILSMLIRARDDDDRQLTDQELRDELITLLFAGHENTAALLAWALHELARDPPSQDRVAAGEHDFTDAVITETLRLRPPVPLLARRLRTPFRVGGHELPAGTNVCPCTLLTHRDEAIYPQPWTFKPERFLEHKPPASEWFPFGAGVRRCVGAAFAQFETRTALLEIVGARRLSADSARPERARTRAVVLVPARGARVTMLPRRHQRPAARTAAERHRSAAPTELQCPASAATPADTSPASIR